MYNFLYINTHDTGRSISPYGYNAPTPNLLDFAKDSMVFTNAFCASPTCSPSRASLLTGQLPHSNGMMGLAHRGFNLYNPEHHLANFLKNKGYQTALSGVQHEYGLYSNVNVEAFNRLGYETVLTADSSAYKDYRKGDLFSWDKENAIRAVGWLNRIDNNKPFYLAYGMNATHRGYPEVADNIDERYVKPAFPGVNNAENRHDEAGFLTSAQYADENVGLILNALKEKGLYDNTIIVYTTDHGVANPYQKCHLNDKGLGVALIIRVPGISNGIVYDGLTSQLDFFPTVCDLLGLEKPDYLQGSSFIDVIKDPSKDNNEEIFAQINFHTSYEPARCIRNKRFKYIRYYDENWLKTNLSNIDESVQKSFLMEHGLKDRQKDREALYDLYYDPDEVNNVIDKLEYQDVLNKLKEDLNRKMQETADPLLNGELEVKEYYKVNKQSCYYASSKDPENYDPRGRH